MKNMATFKHYSLLCMFIVHFPFHHFLLSFLSANSVTAKEMQYIKIYVAYLYIPYQLALEGK